MAEFVRVLIEKLADRRNTSESVDIKFSDLINILQEIEQELT